MPKRATGGRRRISRFRASDEGAQDLGQGTEKELTGAGGSQLPALIEASIVKIYGTEPAKQTAE